MTDSSAQALTAKKCVACEGGVPPVSRSDAESLLRELPGWILSSKADSIEKKWTVKDFVAGMEFLNRVADLAEQEQHHPDVHLTGYRHVSIQLSTHAIGGLSENDFILAAKINQLAVAAQKK